MFYNDADDIFKSHCIGTKLKFIIFPKTCHLTGKTLWLEYAYEQIAMWTGPGDALFEYRWYRKKDFLIARLQNLV